MSLALLSVLGVALDALLGEPKRWHPLVAFGRLADRLERRFNRSRVADSAEKLPFPNPGCAPRSEGRGDRSEQADTVVSAGTFNSLSLQGEGVSASTITPKSDTPGLGWRSHGVTAWIIAVIPLTLIALLLSLLPYVGWIVQVLALYAALGLRSLGEHADPVVLALRSGDLNEARLRVGYVVSRETAELDETAVARAATESVLENGSDAVFAALFWFAVAGAPGVVLYRLSNTLDAMWGYRNARFERFGWAAAKIDDVLNYIPARLVALTYALLGHTRLALRCWRTQAPKWDSPNAGPVMAAGAGALGVSLGGSARYHGELHERPQLGEGPAPTAVDIWRALALVRQGVLLWLLIILILGVL
ncbi:MULTISPECIES: adenosylcobinamide-phosphate synthase CbiB [Pseudomonas]|uniref:adenosylcobinamide-phosphate synthase CbiB n=1 Tax=Pseudomonas TaxID=286 RepID=UPI001E39855F|nr:MULTISPECIES: adenosylcobinamide-phosphate synthase CbiB [Pseudomonas]MCE4071381.1 adenosylcobinamide-phosphate synthase CbiB [Pseudomonas nitritireducens]MCE4080736.1 adenosylcobinamide-phosphate synthase CbiB [Pseudomonas nitroreducens]